ncbi:MAG TPA: TIGR00282 family metallophosphoesterase [Geminicoccus sp.]|uniref:TIGR00282 family metallophosphoesterase n=1 Tax=Geminicoccus sp. TaxID=2024832 RepID=UPI002CF00146|nr:TIGR00282 family metallophosphoesterase [Geminicoccus sp.]HWL67360.1 TIGR00282 family metallophosphoesterase [Geminicoccus sp.]
MRILFVGDVVGRSGRAAIERHLPDLRRRLELDVVVVNAENAAGGYGLTAKIAQRLFELGTDLITLGNHAWDQRELLVHIENEPRIVRPLNMMPGTPGRGIGELRLADGRRFVVLQVLGRLFMGLADDPMRALEAELASLSLPGTADAILIDVHAEATSEKLAHGHGFDGRVSAVVGTHTHVPTADHRVLAGGTAFITDVGMTGDYDSVIGMDKQASLERWRSPLPGRKMEPAQGEATLCAVLIETDDATGLARRIEPVRIGGSMPSTLPAPH